MYIHLASGDGTVMLGIHLSRCVCVRQISHGGEGNALYPVLCSCCCCYKRVSVSTVVQLTVKKTLATFKRTHLDSWHDHKQKFTDDQLLVLTELLVSPNYYA